MNFSAVCLIAVLIVQLSYVATDEKEIENWTVEIVRNKKVVCAGVLLNANFFLTLGKCIDRKMLDQYKVIVGGRESLSIEIVLEKKAEGNTVMMGKFSESVDMDENSISKIPNIADEDKLAESRKNDVSNHVTGIDKKGEPRTIKVDILSNKKCKADFERDEKFCFKGKSTGKRICSLLPGSPIVSYQDDRWTLLGFIPFENSCQKEQYYSLNIASYLKWINYVKKLKDENICNSKDDCGALMKCEKNVCACPYCYTMVDGACEASNRKVLILGAGMAGVSAAKTLGDNGCENVKIIEGSDRIGGRVKSANMSGYTVELGTMWIYGLGSNPVAALANKYGLNMIEDFDTWVVRDSNGDNETLTADNEWYKLVDILDKVKAFTRKMDRNGSPDVTSQALLRKFGWVPDTNVKQAVEVYELDTESGRETPSISGKYFNHLGVFEIHGNDQWMISADPRGLSLIISELYKELPVSHTTTFNQVVKKIKNKNKNGKVEVVTDDGTKYEADDVIVTFSLGVLQSRKVSFVPPLSEEKMMAIDKFGFGEYTVSYFKFADAFWDNTSTLVYASARHGENCIWYNMNTIYPGCNILQLALMGFEANAASRMDDNGVKERGLDALKEMYPEVSIPEPSEFVRGDWLNDPLTKGSFSYWTPAFRPEDMAYLGKSEGNIHFAGEHISLNNHGFLHSAYNSGIETALRLARSVRSE